MFRGFLIIKTTFSYFPGMFENPAPAIKTSCKQNINFKIVLGLKSYKLDKWMLIVSGSYIYKKLTCITEYWEQSLKKPWLPWPPRYKREPKRRKMREKIDECLWEANLLRVRTPKLKYLIFQAIWIPFRLKPKMNSENNQTLVNTNTTDKDVSFLFKFLIFSYMIIVLLVSNISAGTIRAYRRSLPYLRDQI